MVLTVVMPCYNEASRGRGDTSFEARLEKMRVQLMSINYRVIMVDDGSKDNSVEVFTSFVEEHNLDSSWICLQQERNMGKGRAILRGIMSVGADTDYILLLDADMSVEPYRAVPLVNGMDTDECCAGTRYAVTSVIVNPRSPVRKFVSFCCRTLMNMLFGLGVSDSQCGFKLLPTRACKKLTEFAVDSWIYDIEILYHMKAQGITIREAPVRWDNMENESTVKAVNAIIPSTKALFSLFFKKRFIRSLYNGVNI